MPLLLHLKIVSLPRLFIVHLIAFCLSCCVEAIVRCLLIFIRYNFLSKIYQYNTVHVFLWMVDYVSLWRRVSSKRRNTSSISISHSRNPMYLNLAFYNGWRSTLILRIQWNDIGVNKMSIKYTNPSQQKYQCCLYFNTLT